MAVKTVEEVLLSLADNNTGDITPTVIRDAFSSVFFLFASLSTNDNNVTVPASLTWAKLGRYTDVGTPSQTDAVVARASVEQNMQVYLDGRYEISYSVSIEASDSEFRRFGVRKNATGDVLDGSATQCIAGGCASATFHAELSANDIIETYYQTDAGAGATTPRFGSFTIRKIG